VDGVLVVGSRSVIGDDGTSRLRLTRGVDEDGKEELGGEGLVLDEMTVDGGNGIPTGSRWSVDIDDTMVGVLTTALSDTSDSSRTLPISEGICSSSVEEQMDAVTYRVDSSAGVGSRSVVEQIDAVT
jgi:hypothetical protein